MKSHRESAIANLIAVGALLFILPLCSSAAEYSCSAINCFNGKTGMASSLYEEQCKELTTALQRCVRNLGEKTCNYEKENANRACACANSCSSARCTLFATDNSRCYRATFR